MRLSLAAMFGLLLVTTSARPGSNDPSNAIIELISPESRAYENKEVIVVRWRTRHVPPNSGLVLRLVHDHREDMESRTHAGMTGPLTLSPISLGDDADGEFRWTGRSVGCAPSDAPTWCMTKQGSYFIEATVYENPDFSLLGMGRGGGPPRVLARAKSGAIVIEGNFLQFVPK
jgi:hypothetical protein